MKLLRKDLQREARDLMCMSGVHVYERKIGWLPQEHFFDIVWRDRVRWSLAYPWESERHVLREVGWKLRNRVAQEEEFERAIKQGERDATAEAVKKEDDINVMTRDVCRTVVDKPLYFY